MVNSVWIISPTLSVLRRAKANIKNIFPSLHPKMFHTSSLFNDAVYIFRLHLGCIQTTMRADTYQTWYVPEPSSMAGTLSAPPTSVAVSQW